MLETGQLSGHVLTHVFGQDAIDQRLISHVSTPSLAPQPHQDIRVESDGDELSRARAEPWTTDASHRAKLFVRRLRNVREVNPRHGTPPFLCGSPVVR